MSNIVDGTADSCEVERFYVPSEVDPGLEDPGLRDVARDLILATNNAILGLLELVDAEPVEGTAEAILDQKKVDCLTAGIVGDEAFSTTQKLGTIFAELDRTVEDVQGSSTLIRDGVAALVYADPNNRQESRGYRGLPIAKCRKLVDSWRDSNIILTPEQILKITSDLVDPIQDVQAYVAEVTRQDPVQLPSMRKALITQERIDPTTRLGALKYLVASSIVEIYKDEQVIEACHKLFDDDEKSEVGDSESAPYYWATTLMSAMKTEHGKGLGAELSMLLNLHTKKRLLRIPGREFKNTLATLKTLGNLYIDLEFVEGVLKGLPAQIGSMRDFQSKIMKHQAGKVVVSVLHQQQNFYAKLIEVQNPKYAAADKDDRNAVWEESIRSEDIINESAGALADCLDTLGIRVSPRIRQILEEHRIPKISNQLDDFNERAKAKELLEAAEAVSKEILAIDGKYDLPNKRFRERTPELIGLARVLSESLRDHEPLAEHDARALVGLMLGVYWESTGEHSSVQNRAEHYIEDAEQIRGLTAKLESLGHAQDSQLLKLVNLLDELIDSGLFDNAKKHPEFELKGTFVLVLGFLFDYTNTIQRACVGGLRSCRGVT